MIMREYARVSIVSVCEALRTGILASGSLWEHYPEPAGEYSSCVD